MNKSEKYVQCQLGITSYLKIREYATLHSISLSRAIKHAVEYFIEEKSKNVSEEIE